MSDDQDSGSSSGLIIGLVAGAIVVVLLVVVGIFAVGWLMHARVEEAHDVAVKNEVVLADLLAELKDAGDPVQPAPLPGDPRARLVGTWERKSDKGGVSIMEYREDGTVLMTTKVGGKADVVQPLARWQVRQEPNELKLILNLPDREPNEYVLQFLDEDRFNIPAMVGGGLYERKRAAKP